MTAQLIDGKAFAALLAEDSKKKTAALARAPGFAAILVGDNPASELYVRLKGKACLEAGVKFERHLLAADAGQAALFALIAELNGRDDIDAILIQLPLPSGFDYDTDAAILALDPHKDVDGFHPDNLARLQRLRPRVVSPLVAGIMLLMQNTREVLRGKRALVIANSPTFYEPLEATLKFEGMEPAFSQPDDADLLERTRAADAVIIAVGRAGFLKGDMLKPGAIVIDVGTNRIPAPSVIPAEAGIQQYKTVGDADESVRDIAGFLTPVPGGVGPMTVAMVVMNAIKLATFRQTSIC
jgi:methylenetetrahydrofolate dehydrogenase (NADP+)/methenyltetrahydrofolate cyclohydrolase